MEAYQPLIKPLIEILVVIFAFVIIKKIYEFMTDKFSKKTSYNNLNETNFNEAYSQKKYFFSFPELQFYYLLKDFLNKEYH
jgi:hypothetical protein